MYFEYRWRFFFDESEEGRIIWIIHTKFTNVEFRGIKPINMRVWLK